jgi:hypothetical protein
LFNFSYGRWVFMDHAPGDRKLSVSFVRFRAPLQIVKPTSAWCSGTTGYPWLMRECANSMKQVICTIECIVSFSMQTFID